MPSSHSVPNAVLDEMFRTGKVQSLDGAEVELSAQILPEYAGALYSLVSGRKPKTCLEIGMACGASSLSILTALDQTDSGRLISIDPGQHTLFRGAGVAAVARAGFSARHELIEDYDYRALPRLLEDGVVLDFAYVDGMHTFDYTLLDFFYIDKMLRVGGAIGFNDCGYRAVNRVLRFVLTHRKYRPIDSGLKRDFRARNFAVSLARRALNFSQEDRYFEKIEDWEPPWNFYAPF